MMVRLLVALVAVGALRAVPATAQPSHGEETAAQVFTAERLEQAGVSRWSDLLELIDGWDAHAIDGYSWSASAGGLAPPGTARWAVFVDGIPIDLASFDRISLNLLPIHLAQVDSILVLRAPDFREGVFAAAGALHVYTRKPARRVEVRGSISAGNEVNDPGPFRYTEHASPNIDRSGPLLFAEGSLAGGPAFARFSIQSDEHHATDERIIERVRVLYRQDGPPRLQQTAHALQLGLGGPHARHLVLAGWTKFNDLRFTETYGAEVPTTHRFRFAALRGEVGDDATVALGYRASYTRHALDLRPNRDTLAFGFAQEQLNVHVGARTGAGAFRGALGTGLRYYLTSTPMPLRDPSLLVTNAYARLAAHPSTWSRAALTAYVSHTYDRLGTRLLAELDVLPARRHRAWLRAALVRETIEEQDSPWYWIAQGYRPPQHAEAVVEGLSFLPLTTTATTDLGWSARLHRHVYAEAAGRYRRFAGHYAPQVRFVDDSTSAGYIPGVRVATGVSGTVLGTALQVRFTGVDRLEQRLYYDYTRPLWSNPTFWATWSAQPWHQASYDVLYTPVPRFSLHARLRYRSASYWPGFEGVEGDTSGGVAARIPPSWLLDVTARKRFWGDRLRAGVTLHNLLNEPYRTHPAGAVTDLYVTFRLDVAFGVGAAAP